MNKLQKNFKEGVTTTILGFMLLIGNFYYLTEKDGDATIFFGTLLISLALFLAPDDLVKGIKSLIKRNQDKEI
jgi:hypothetical protein